MLVLRCTPKEHAQEQVARLRRLGCSEAYLERVRAGILAHTRPGPTHPYGQVWLLPDERPPTERYRETNKNRESHGYI